jgi:hypothetical protein
MRLQYIMTIEDRKIELGGEVRPWQERARYLV